MQSMRKTWAGISGHVLAAYWLMRSRNRGTFSAFKVMPAAMGWPP